MDEASHEVGIEYDLKGGRIVLSEVDPEAIRQLKKKFGKRKKITLQSFEDGVILSESGVFMSSADIEHAVGYA